MKTNLTPEQLTKIGIEAILAYHKETEFDPTKVKSIEELMAFSSLHLLTQRKQELKQRYDSIKYDLNIKGIPCDNDENYVETYARLREVEYLLSEILPD